MSGGRTTFAELAGQVGDNSPVDGKHTGKPAVVPPNGLRSVPVSQLALNPFNPRDSLGDLDGLASIVQNQLAPVVAVTVAKFKALYPDAEVVGRYVVINGNRRLAAARKFGRPKLDVVVRDDLAQDKGALLTAAVLENLAREGFDLIEEAKAIDQLVREYGSTDDVARHLAKSQGYVSQRRSLLKLTPELQDAVRRGDLPFREAREFAKLPPTEQHQRFFGAEDTVAQNIDKSANDANEPSKPKRGSGEQANRARSLSRSLKKFDSDPAALASMLRDELGETRLKTLVGLLKKLV
jgi:ParB family chromosome partitioning protein